MSTKKQRRRTRQRQKGTTKAKLSPVTIFLLSIAALLLAVGVIGSLVGNDRPPPPRPGAVWSETHGHYH
ncbi:MAG TPA: hypothetical protein DIU18_07120 [Gemmatimonadetes bacterium]|nr:hypothetical protein [Gemmatimonadota bacterium]